ncbi:MAG: hypothetical protein WC530_08405 [Candidatus Omnitrophota bacterium]|jgi:hypothetical protein
MKLWTNFVVLFILCGGLAICYLLTDPFYVGSPEDDSLKLTGIGYAVQLAIFVITFFVIGTVVHWLQESEKQVEEKKSAKTDERPFSE